MVGRASHSSRCPGGRVLHWTSKGSIMRIALALAVLVGLAGCSAISETKFGIGPAGIEFGVKFRKVKPPTTQPIDTGTSTVPPVG